MDKVIDRLSPNQLGSLGEALLKTKRLNQAVESCPFGHVRKKRILLSNDVYYAKFEQRAAIKAGNRYEFYIPSMESFIDKNDVAKTLEIINDHAELAFDDRCPEEFTLAKILEFLLGINEDCGKTLSLLSTLLSTCASRPGNLSSTADTIVKVLKYENSEDDPMLLQLVTRILSKNSNSTRFSGLLRAMLDILNDEIDEMKAKVKIDDYTKNLIKVDTKFIPAAYYLFHRVHGKNSCPDQLDKWAKLLSFQEMRS